MQQIKTHRVKLAAAAVSAVLLAGASAASADVVARFNFEEFTTDNVTWPANNGPYTNSATSSIGSATAMSTTGLSNLEALSVRDDSFGDLPSYAVLNGPSSIDDVIGSDDDFFGFTLTAGAVDLDFGTFNFEFGSSNDDNNTSLGHDGSAQLFVSIDGGAFASVGDLQQRSTGPGPADVFTGMVLSSIDLTGMGLAAGQSAEFRVSIADNRGYGSDSGALYFDNFELNATAVPEPTSLALLGLAGAGLLARRRRI